jgi:hypothetical protein
MTPLQSTAVWYGAGSIVWWISAAVVVGVTLSWLVAWWACLWSASSGARVVLADPRVSRPGRVRGTVQPGRWGDCSAPMLPVRVVSSALDEQTPLCNAVLG